MSKSVLLRGLLLRAWRERWNDCQWGLNIKKILPRGVSGDAYNLADCILQQAVIGSGANQLILSYLRHSLCSHLISHAAVLKWISNYENPDHSHCLLALLEFVDSIIPGVTCSNRQEEILMVDATNILVRWLWRVYSRCKDPNDDQVLAKLTNVLDKVCNNEFLLGILCLAKVDNGGPVSEVASGMTGRKQTSPRSAAQLKIEKHFQTLLDQKIENLAMVRIERRSSAAITHILQPLLVVELLKNASNDTRIISQLLLVQKLKRFSRPQFYCEILRSCLLTLQNVSGTPRESLWCAFTFIKMPQILKQLNAMTPRSGMEMEADTNADLLQAIDLLLEETSLLDILDFKCSLNTMECLMKEFQKHGLVTDKHTEHYAAKREGISANVQKLDPSTQTPSIVKFVIRAEQPLSGILKTLNTDYNKVQDAMLSLLFQVLHGNSLELILSVATVEGKLKTFVNRLIKCNECSKQVPGETGKPAATRAAIFDVTFLYLTYIVQTYGTDLILVENGDSFFETWVRQAMVDRKKLKSPMTIVRSCDQGKVDELLMYLNSANHSSNTTLKWHEICDNIPAMLYHVLLAWENGLPAGDVKVILDNLKSKMGAYSVCAASWLCSYLYAINEREHQKPINMIQQLLSGSEEMTSVENLKERQGLTNQIIRRMQTEFQSRGSSNAAKRTGMNNVNYSIVSSTPLEECFNNAWEQISEKKWLSVEVAQTLESLYESCGAFWLVHALVHELDNCKYVTEIDQVTDIVFSIMHLDIEAMTVALISELLPVLVSSDLSHPYTTAIARLCVYVILSANEKCNQETPKKRFRMDVDETTMEPITKIRKLDTEFTDDAFGSAMDTSGGSTSGTKEGSASGSIKEPLCGTLKEMFKRFSQYIASDEYSPRVNFIFEFITILVECGKSEALPILKLIPPGFVQNLLKIMPLSNIKPGLVLQIYDLSTATGRQSALSDLCVLRRNIQINCESIKL